MVAWIHSWRDGQKGWASVSLHGLSSSTNVALNLFSLFQSPKSTCCENSQCQLCYILLEKQIIRTARFMGQGKDLTVLKKGVTKNPWTLLSAISMVFHLFIVCFHNYGQKSSYALSWYLFSCAECLAQRNYSTEGWINMRLRVRQWPENQDTWNSRESLFLKILTSGRRGKMVRQD